MNFVSFFRGLAVSALFLSALPAAAITLDFESGTYNLTGPNQVYEEAGYTFSTPNGNHFDSNNSPLNTVFPGGLPHLVFHEAANNPVNNLVTLSFGGALFDLISFDLVFNQAVRNRNPAINPIMTILGSGGQSLQTPSNGFLGTVNTPGFTGVSFVTFDINFNSTLAGNVILDNVQVQASGVPPVPVPASAYLLVLGVASFGAVRAKRRARAS